MIIILKQKQKLLKFSKNIDSDKSNEFLTIFDETSELIVNKIFKIFNYYLLMILPEIKGEIRNYQEITEFEIENKLDNNLSPKLNEYFQKQHIINREDLENAIRLFITLVLFREKDKENKIKLNRKNIIDYLKQSDLWNSEIFKNEKFNENLDELKLCNIQINNIMLLYDFLVEKVQKIKKNEEEKDEIN